MDNSVASKIKPATVSTKAIVGAGDFIDTINATKFIMSSYNKNTDNNLILILDLSTILASGKNLNIHPGMILHIKLDNTPSFFDWPSLTSTSCYIVDGISNEQSKLKVP